MSSYNFLVDSLIEAYCNISKPNYPTWAVHKRNSDEIVKPTIPFVGKSYAEQNVKILIYASAENLANYWRGNDKHWAGDWLDDDSRAINRHRYCFDDVSMQHSGKLPYVHCGPMEDGALLTAAMYLSYKLRGGNIDEPYSFYETIAFGNYGKFSIETELQYKIRNNPHLTNDEIRVLKKELDRKNIDYATMCEYLKVSHDFVKVDIDILSPDIIIMPSMEDNGFIESIKGKAEIIRIYQMMPLVINNMGENGRNNKRNQFKSRDISTLPIEIQKAYHLIKGINHYNYSFVFDHLDFALKRLNKKL